MMGWLRDMLARYNPQRPPAPVSQDDRDELDEARREHKRILGRADEAVREAMSHADEVFKAAPAKSRRPHR